MKGYLRIIGVFAVIYVAVSAVVGLQHLFDKGDIKKASKVLYELKPGDGSKTLLQWMAVEKGLTQDDLECYSQLVSRYEGLVNLECSDFVWQVNVVAGQVLPANEPATQLMKKIQEQS